MKTNQREAHKPTKEAKSNFLKNPSEVGKKNKDPREIKAQMLSNAVTE
jgi:hypothetical protein